MLNSYKKVPHKAGPVFQLLAVLLVIEKMMPVKVLQVIGINAAKALAVHSCTWPGIPLIYSGQEMPNTKRLKFFDKDAIDWKERNLLQNFYSKLLHLHSSHPALHAGSEVYPLHTSSDKNILAYARKQKEGEVVVILNLSAHLTRFDLLSNWLDGVFTELFSGQQNDFSSQKSFEMKAWDYKVFYK